MRKFYREIVGVGFVCLSWLVLGVTDFNSRYVYPQDMGQNVHGFTSWLSFVSSHNHEFSQSLMFSANGIIETLVLLIYAMPVIALFISRTYRKIQNAIILTLFLGLLVDFGQLFSFNGIGLANGGYDIGPYYFLHFIFGSICFIFVFVFSIGRAFKYLTHNMVHGEP
jgi:hypothetical protein